MDDDDVELVLVLLLLLQLVVVVELERNGGDKRGFVKDTTAGDESETASAT